MLPPHLQPVVDRELEHDRELLREASTPLELGTLPLAVAARIDPRAAELARRAGVACGKGCSWCCRGLRVEVPPPEAIAIAELLRIRHAERLPEVTAELGAAAERARALSPREQWLAHVPCHFLEPATGACSIYDFRPLGCRSLTSLDESACKAVYDGAPGATRVPSPPPVTELYHAARLAQHLACDEAGLDMRPLELTAAVERALGTPDFALRWRAGEPVFDSNGAPRARAELVPIPEIVAKSRARAANAKKRDRRARRA